MYKFRDERVSEEQHNYTPRKYGNNGMLSVGGDRSILIMGFRFVSGEMGPLKLHAEMKAKAKPCIPAYMYSFVRSFINYSN